MNFSIENKRQDYRDVLLCILCMITACCFLFGHIFSNGILVYLASLLLLILFVLYSGRLLLIELFFLPFANIIKISSGQACLLNYFMILGALIYIVKRYRKVKLNSSVFLSLALFLLLLFKAWVQSFEFSAAYLRIIITMIIIPLLFINDLNTEKTEENVVTKSALFLSIGVLLASLMGYSFFDNPKLSLFFSNTDHYYVETELYSRFCGLSSDPNYYSSFALMGTVVNLFLYIYKKSTYHILLAIACGFFGILSLSKMFFIILSICVVLFFIALVRENLIKTRTVIMASVLIVISVFFIMYSYSHFDLLRVVMYRINSSDSLHELSTGRSTIWLNYLEAIFSSYSTILIGVSSDELLVGINHTHNTLLQMLWKFGVIGLFIFIGWFICLRKRISNRGSLGVIMLIIGYLGPSLALDMMVFDAFYWNYLFFLYITIEYPYKLYNQKNNNNALVSSN